MIPLVPALVLAFVSFIASAFVILRIIVPILPPHPLSRRVSPAEFGLPTFRSLSPADKGHLWLAGFDLLSLCVFIWQVAIEATTGPVGHAIGQDSLSTVRLWFIMTLRQGCLLVIVTISLLHVRMGRSVSFGKKHWMLWSPVVLLAMTSTALAGVLSGAGVDSLFQGLTAYTIVVALLTTAAFGCLIGTLFIIKRNLASLNEERDPWPPVQEKEEQPRPSFATEEIDAIRDGASWITSTAGSRRNSMSAWSFSTHHTIMASSQHGHSLGRPQTATHPSIPAKSSFWFSPANNDEFIPPVPPLPSPYGPATDSLSDPDPFRRSVPPLPSHPRGRLGSQTSWLTSSNGSQTTMTAWSFPTSQREGTIRNFSTPDLQTAFSRPVTPALADAQVLGGYGYVHAAETGLAALAAPQGTEIHVSLHPIIGWSSSIWLPLCFAIPYFIVLSQQATASMAVYILYVLSVTLSAPLLAFNLSFNSGLPIPTGLFDIRNSAMANRLSTSPSELPPYKWSHEYKRSMSTTPTVVEGRRSGDVWIAKGDAVDGKSKLSRAISMLSPKPKLSVLPPEELEEELRTPPLPIQDEDSSLPVNIYGTPHSDNSVQFGRLRKESKASSHFSGGDESLAYASRIMIAQRHYSALAQTVVVQGSTPPENTQDSGANLFIGNSTSVVLNKPLASSHLRSRSTSSVVSGPQTPTGNSFNNISPPPSFPLPPTPPNVRAARLALMAHKKSFSSGFSFGPVDNMNEIDALTAGVLPLLVPGLKVGEEMKIKGDDCFSPGTFSKGKGRKVVRKLNEFGEDFSSPEIHSTPARRRPRESRSRKESGHKKNHFSLPSLSLGKDGVHSVAAWSAEIRGAIEGKVGQYTAIPSNIDLGYRNTVFGGDSTPNSLPQLQAVREEDERPGARLGRTMSTRSLGLRADVPHNVDTARSSIISNGEVPLSAASTVTLFEDFEAGITSHPQAQSTPHNMITSKPASRQTAPPLPAHRRSSIVYITSEDPTISTNQTPESTVSAFASFTQWSTRAVRPLIPKTSLKVKRKITDPSNGKSDPPREGLRPLALLQDRDTNSTIDTNPDSSVRPLTLGKKQKSSRVLVGAQDENVVPNLDSRIKNLKPLKLVRSETSKMRGILRKSEVLPDVVVRPPSTTEHTAFAYSFHD